MQTEIWFAGTELKGVHSGWRTVRVLKTGRKWMTLEINRKSHRVLKSAWGQWPRAKGSDPDPRACELKPKRRKQG